jgi:hypothetical protein
MAANFDNPDAVVGYEVEIYINNFRTKTIWKHWIGSEGTCRRKGILFRDGWGVASMEPITAAQWIRGYGDPRIKDYFGRS